MPAIANAEGNLLRLSDQEQEHEEQVLSEGDRDMMEARRDFWSTTSPFPLQQFCTADLHSLEKLVARTFQRIHTTMHR